MRTLLVFDAAGLGLFCVSGTDKALDYGLAPVATIGASGGEGHSDTAMTLRRYAHVLEDMEDEGGRAMDELF